ncbi:MAG: DUF2959 domain-containing protein [Gammaproteobacteria bacterium]
MTFILRLPLILFVLIFPACSTVYLNTLESIGIPKREIMVYRVEKARDTQQETKEQFKSALHRFTAITRFEGGNLEDKYEEMNGEYEASAKKAAEVRKRIEDIEDVSEALFTEWEEELKQYSNASLRSNSQRKLAETRSHYKQLISSMRRAESKIEPVLSVFRDQVLYLKHNLNAQAIASLKGELRSIESDVSTLVKAMEQSINEANAFIRTIEN